MRVEPVEKLFLINIYAWLLFGFAQAALINLILKITYSLDNFPCQLTFMSKPISIYILCLHQLPLLTRRAIPSIYFNAWPVSLLAALRNLTQKNKDICFLEKNYKFVPRIYYGQLAEKCVFNILFEPRNCCNFVSRKYMSSFFYV